MNTSSKYTYEDVEEVAEKIYRTIVSGYIATGYSQLGIPRDIGKIDEDVFRYLVDVEYRYFDNARKFSGYPKDEYYFLLMEKTLEDQDMFDKCFQMTQDLLKAHHVEHLKQLPKGPNMRGCNLSLRKVRI